RPPKGRGGPALQRAFATALAASVESPEKQLGRGARGFRLLRPSDVTGPVQATHVAEVVDLAFTARDPDTQTERHPVKVPAGAGAPVANPSLPFARAAAASAAALATAATKDAALLRALAAPAPACTAQTAVCDLVPNGLAGLADAHARAATERAAAAQEAAQK